MRQEHVGGQDSGSANAPRWVKVLAIIALVVILVLAIMFLAGVGGEHGPGRHMSASGFTDSAAGGGARP